MKSTMEQMARELNTQNGKEKEITREGHSHYSPSEDNPSRMEPQKDDFRIEQYRLGMHRMWPHQNPKTNFENNLADRIIEEIHQKLSNEHIMGNINDFLKLKEPFQTHLLCKSFPHH